MFSKNLFCFFFHEKRQSQMGQSHENSQEAEQWVRQKHCFRCWKDNSGIPLPISAALGGLAHFRQLGFLTGKEGKCPHVSIMVDTKCSTAHLECLAESPWSLLAVIALNMVYEYGHRSCLMWSIVHPPRWPSSFALQFLAKQ